MAVPAGPYVEGWVRDLAARLQDVASQLYDLDQSASLAVLDESDKYVGRTRDVLADVARDRQWLWPAYTAAREQLDLALEHVERRKWDEARRRVVTPLDAPGVPAHEDLGELVTLIADTAKAVLDVALLVVPKMGEHLGSLASLRTRIGTIEEDAATVGLSHDEVIRRARVAVDDALDRVTADPLSVDPAQAELAVKAAAGLVDQAKDELARLPRRLGQADSSLLELEVLITRGREALERTREKVADPQGLLVPLAPDHLNHGHQALRPWLERLSQAAAEGDNRAALVGMRSWERILQQTREQAERIAAANAAPLARRDELRGLVGALRAKAAASGLAEDDAAQALHDAAHDELWVAPCNLARAEAAVEEYRRFLADR